MRPFVLVVAPNPFEDASTQAYECDFWLRTSSGHLASFSNLVRLFNPVGRSKPTLDNRWKAIRPLAGYFLESFLKTHGYDARAAFSLEEAAGACRVAAPAAVALSTTFITSATQLASTLRRLREVVPADVPIVVGGQLVWKHYLWGPDRFAERPEVQSRPELAPVFGPHGDPALRDPLYVASEFGEHTLLRVLEALGRGGRTGDDVSSVANLVFWAGEGWRSTARAEEPIDLDREFTRWDVVDEIPATMVPVRTSVGCPHACEFCDFVAVHPRLRLRSPSSVVEELRLIAARGGTSINFVDDNAFSSSARARDLARAIAGTGLGLRWGGYMRADRVKEEDAALFAQAGLLYGWCGVESGDPQILAGMKKRSNLEATRAGIEALSAAGVHVLTTFVLGFPGETRASIDASIAFLNAFRRDTRGRVEYSAFPFQLLPGAPVDRPERRRELGLTGLLDRWDHPTMSAEDVRSTWAPHFFRGVDASYTYYGGDDSSLWGAARRGDAIAQRKAVTVAFLDGAPDEVVQDRFAALYRTLHFTPGEVPDWREHLAPRELQPQAPGAKR
jgi:radical SAM superfamily enzyme YgiQ (UPF0313 family)